MCVRFPFGNSTGCSQNMNFYALFFFAMWYVWWFVMEWHPLNTIFSQTNKIAKNYVCFFSFFTFNCPHLKGSKEMLLLFFFVKFSLRNRSNYKAKKCDFPCRIGQQKKKKMIWLIYNRNYTFITTKQTRIHGEIRIHTQTLSHAP